MFTFCNNCKLNIKTSSVRRSYNYSSTSSAEEHKGAFTSHHSLHLISSRLCSEPKWTGLDSGPCLVQFNSIQARWDEMVPFERTLSLDVGHVIFLWRQFFQNRSSLTPRFHSSTPAFSVPLPRSELQQVTDARCLIRLRPQWSTSSWQGTRRHTHARVESTTTISFLRSLARRHYS